MKVRFSILSAILTLVCTVMLALPALATGPNQSYPAAAYDARSGMNRHLVVYYVDGAASTPYVRTGAHIAGQFVNSLTGDVIGDPFAISEEGAVLTSSDIQPDVAFVERSQGGGSYCVAWANDMRESTPQVYVQMLNADDGSLIGDNLLVSSNDHTATKGFVSIAGSNLASEFSKFMVAWYQVNGSSFDIVATLVKPDGTIEGGVVNVADNATYHQTEPDVTYDSVNSRYLVVFKDSRNTHYQIYGQYMVDSGDGLVSAGTATSVNFPISEASTGGDCYYPAVVFDPATQSSLVVWEDERNAAETGADIYGQVVISTTLVLGQDLAICDNVHGQYVPALDASGLGVVGVVWQDNRYDPLTGTRSPYGAVFGRMVNLGSGNYEVYPERAYMVTGLEGNASYPAVAYGGDLSALVFYVMGSSSTTVEWARMGTEQLTDTLDSHLVGRWAFNEGSGTVAHDAAANGHDGTISGAQWTMDKAKAAGSALYFDGVSSVSIPISAAFNEAISSSLTLAGWIYMDPDSDDTYRTMVAKAESDYSFWLGTYNGSPKFRLSSGGTGWDEEVYASDIHLNTGQWYYLTGTFDGATMKLYINGNLVGTGVLAGSIYESAAALTIGSGDGKYFLGSIDDVRIYDRALNFIEIAETAGLESLVRGYVSVDGSFEQGVIVQATSNADGALYSTESDAYGYYYLFVPNGCYELSIDPSGSTSGVPFQPSDYIEAGSAYEGGVIRDYNLYTGPVFTLSGTIRDSSSNPVEAFVFYQNETFGIYHEVTTDGYGGYSLTNLPEGDGVVGVRPMDDSYAVTASELSITDSGTYDFTVYSGTYVYGTVSDMEGYAVAGVPVTYYAREDSPIKLTEYTDEKGEFNILGVPDGGEGFVVVQPDPDTLYCASGRHYVTFNYMNNGLAAGLIRLERGSLVSGYVYDATSGKALSAVDVEAGNLSMHAYGRTCLGAYTMVLPEGQHTIYYGGFYLDGQGVPNWNYPEQPNSLLAGMPVTVTVTSADVLSDTLTVLAPDMYVTILTDGGALAVVVEEDPNWTATGGQLVCSAYVPGALSGAFDPNVTVQNPVSTMVLTDTLGVITPMMPFPLGESFDLYLCWVQTNSLGGDSVTILDSALNVPITRSSSITFTLPAAVNTMAYGNVVADSYSGAPGALVYITNSSGEIVGWTYNTVTGYELYCVPVDTGYTVSALDPSDGAFTSESGFATTEDGLDSFESLNLSKSYTPALTVIETHRVNADTDAFTGSRSVGGGYQYQTRHSLWLEAPYGVHMNIASLNASLQPGQAVENVLASVDELNDGVWMTQDFIPESNTNVCGPQCTEICTDPRYSWENYPLYYYYDMTSGIDFSFVESQTSTWSNALEVTRTFDVTSGAESFQQMVTVEATVVDGTPGDVFTGTLQIRIYEGDFALGSSRIQYWTPGVDEYESDVDDSYNSNWGYSYYNIENPIVGHTYSYTKPIDFNVTGNVSNDVFFKPRTRVRLTRYEGQANFWTDEFGLNISDSGSLGTATLNAETSLEWLPGFVQKINRTEVQHKMEIGEIGAARPQVIAQYPAAGAIGIPTSSVISMTIDKPGMYDGYFLNVMDQWGNLLVDTELGPSSYSIGQLATNKNYDTLTFTPDSGYFEPGTAYAVTAILRDSTYYQMDMTTDPWDTLSFWFATAPEAGDTTPPTVVSTVPYDGETGVPTVMPKQIGSKHILITFSEAVQDSGTYSISMFRLDALGGTNQESVSISSQWRGNTYALYPDAELLANTPYRIILFTGIEDLSGNSLASNYQWEFTTGDADTQGPTLSMPLDGATDVATSSPSIVLYADEELDKNSLVMGTTLHLYAGGQDVSSLFDVQYLYPQQGVQIFLNPENQFTTFPNDMVITLTVDTELPSAVTDVAGNAPLGGAAEQSFSWRTVPTFGNAMPSFYSMVTRVAPRYPKVYTTPGGVYIHASAKIGDDYFDGLGYGMGYTGGKSTSSVDPVYGTVVTMTIGSYSVAMENYGAGFWNYQTYTMPPGEAVVSGTHNLEMMAYDTACHEAGVGRPVRVYGSTPDLVSPYNGNDAVSPVTVEWAPMSEVVAGYYVQFSLDYFSSWIASYFIPDDGRAANYTFTVPEDLDLGGPGAAVQWRVVAAASENKSFGDLGGAISEQWEFILGEDTAGPYVNSSTPMDEALNVEPMAGFSLVIMDDTAGVDSGTIDVMMGSLPVTGLTIDDTNPNEVLVEYVPDTPWFAGDNLTLSVYCQDKLGKNIDPYPTVISFMVRANRDSEDPILVPTEYGSLQDALDSTTYGDHIFLEAGTQTESIAMTSRHTGITLSGAGYENTILAGSGTTPVIDVGLSSEILIQNMTITGGTFGVKVYGGTFVDVMNCQISGNTLDGINLVGKSYYDLTNNLIHNNGGWGVYLYNLSVFKSGTPMEAELLNNTIANNGGGGIYSYAGDNHGYYNIVAFNIGNGIYLDTEYLTMDYNLVYGNTENYTGLSAGTNDVQEDPLFLDTTQAAVLDNDFHLNDGSPAINLIPNSVPGEDPPPAAPGDDLDGNLRPQYYPSGDYDAGCYEMLDFAAPAIIWASPSQGDTGASPAGPWKFELQDLGSGIDEGTLYVSVNSGDLSADIQTTSTVTGTLVVTVTPMEPASLNDEVCIDVSVSDYAGNSLSSEESYCFYTRSNTTLFVNPGDSISDVLSQAVNGDTVYVYPGDYVDNLIVPALQSGVRLVSANGPKTTTIASLWQPKLILNSNQILVEVEAPVGPVVQIEGVSSFEISGFTLVGGSSIVHISQGADNVIISGNVISGSAGTVVDGGLSGLWMTEPGIYTEAEGSCLIENNLIMQNSGCGIEVYDANIESPSQPTVTIVNNTVAFNSASGISETDSDVEAYYNIIAYNTQYGLEGITGFSNDYNCMFENQSGHYYGASAGVHALQTDPKFADPANLDFTLMPDSPCVDAFDEAEALSPPEAPDKDLLRRTRPQLEGYDLGCYELADTQAPYLLWAIPTAGVEASPTGPWTFEAADDISGVNPLSTTVSVADGAVTGVLTTTTTISGTVLGYWTPDAPLTNGESMFFRVGLTDYAGNGTVIHMYVTVRDAMTITVPTDYDTIQGGLDAAASGDTVLVEAGTYTENLEITDQHNGVALVGAGAGSTFISGVLEIGGDFSVPVLPTVEITGTDGFTLEGFTITNGTEGVLVNANTDNVLIRKNILCSNYGDNLLIYSVGPNVRVENNLIRYSALASGISIQDYRTDDDYQPAPEIVNNTVVSNTLAGITTNNSTPVFLFNVSAMNGTYGYYFGNSLVTRGYNCGWDNPSGNFSAGMVAGSIEADPMFVDAANGDFTLMPDSPAIDAIPQSVAETGTVAAPNDDLLDRSRPLGPNNYYDMGCYEEYGLVITSTPPDTVVEGGVYTYQPTAYGSIAEWGFGPDNDSPTGLGINNQTGEITFTAGASDAGTYTVQISATDTYGRTTYQAFTLTITSADNPPEAPVANVVPPYYAMVNRDFSLAFTSTDPDDDTLEFSLVTGPVGMALPDVYTPAIEWTPTQGQEGAHAFQVTVTDGTHSVQGDSLTVTVLDPLALNPVKASPLIMVTDAVTTTVAINCEISGGLAPYTAYVQNPTYGTITDLDAQAGTFTFMPLEKGSTSLWVYDAAGFGLTAGPYNIQKVEATLVASPRYAPAGQGFSLGVSDPESDLDGLGFTVPNNSTGAPLTFTVGMVTGGTPYLSEGSSPVVQIGPEGTTFSIPASLAFPYYGGGNINDQLVFTFNTETGRWEYVPDEGNNGTSITVNLEHLSLYTLAEPSVDELNVTGGTAVDSYRMISFPLYPAAETSIVDILGDATNLGPYDDTKWRIFAFDPLDQASGDANEYYVEGSEADFDQQFPMEPGQAYWLISRYAKTLDVPGLNVDDSQDYYMTLQSGWNMIGNPFDHYVNWNLTLASTDGETYYWPNSTDSPLYEKDLFTYDPDNAAAGDDGYVIVTQMEPNGGYWINNPEGMPVTLRIPTTAFSDVKKIAARKTETGLLASISRTISHTIQKVALADTDEERPPRAPGTSGANAGTSNDSIGVAEGGGSGGCFVNTATGKKGGCAWPLVMLLAGGLLAACLTHKRNA